MKIRLDLKQLRQNVISYANDPSSRKELAKQTSSVLTNVVVLVFIGLLGLLLICTIVFAKIGWELAKDSFTSIVTGVAFSDPVKMLAEKFGKSYISVGSPVMIGPQGCGLVLISRSKQAASQPQYLGKKAQALFEYYSGQRTAKNDDDQKLIEMLQDDQFVPNRLRAVPPSHADGQELILLDTEIETDLVAADESGLQLVLCALVGLSSELELEDQRAYVMNLPWYLTDTAIRKL